MSPLHINVNGAEEFGLSSDRDKLNEAEAPGLPTEVQDPGSGAGGEDKAAAFPTLNDEIDEKLGFSWV